MGSSPRMLGQRRVYITKDPNKLISTLPTPPLTASKSYQFYKDEVKLCLQITEIFEEKQAFLLELTMGHYFINDMATD